MNPSTLRLLSSAVILPYPMRLYLDPFYALEFRSLLNYTMSCYAALFLFCSVLSFPELQLNVVRVRVAGGAGASAGASAGAGWTTSHCVDRSSGLVTERFLERLDKPAPSAAGKPLPSATQLQSSASPSNSEAGSTSVGNKDDDGNDPLGPTLAPAGLTRQMSDSNTCVVGALTPSCDTNI